MLTTNGVWTVLLIALAVSALVIFSAVGTLLLIPIAVIAIGEGLFWAGYLCHGVLIKLNGNSNMVFHRMQGFLAILAISFIVMALITTYLVSSGLPYNWQMRLILSFVTVGFTSYGYQQYYGRPSEVPSRG